MLLRDKDRQLLLDIAAQTFTQPVTILAYGSRVTGDAHDTSDLDLVVCPPHINSHFHSDHANKDIDIVQFHTDVEQFREAVSNSNIPIIVQIMDWTKIPESFKKNILAGNEVLI